MEARIALLEAQLRQEAPPVLNFPTLCDILAPAPSDDPNRATHFDIVFKHPARDLAFAIAEEGGPNCPLKDQSQLLTLFARPQFTRWLNSDSHSLLYVDAALEAADKPLSAASLLSAKLVAAVPAVFGHTAIVLHFFCGLHLSDEWCGPKGMMRSLIVQLLMRLVDLDPETEWRGLQFVGDEDFANIDQFKKALKARNTYALCTAFHRLLRELPKGMTVFVVLDSVLFWERNKTPTQFQEHDSFWDGWGGDVLGFLDELIRAWELPVSVKVLMINQARRGPGMRKLPVVQRWGKKGSVIELNNTLNSGEGMWGKRVENQLRRAVEKGVFARG